MSDYPIIFSGPMVRALLDGRKSMTRRLAWHNNKKTDENYVEKARPSPWQRVKPGDRLWVREGWCQDGSHIFYRATHTRYEDDHDSGWSSPIHMRRADSRLTLNVTAAKIERLQEISETDAKAEGVTLDPAAMAKFGYPQLYKFAFADLWEELHGAGAFDRDPEVVALTFTVHRSNIDATS